MILSSLLLSRVLLSALFALLMLPLATTLAKIIAAPVRPPNQPSRMPGVEVREQPAVGDTGPLIETTITEEVISWGLVWPKVGEFDAFGIHRTVAAVGLAGISVGVAAILFCIWKPNLQ